MEFQSILDVLLAYKSHLELTEGLLKANQVYSQTKSAIVRHLIAGWDESLMPNSSQQLTKAETARIQEFLEKTPVSKLSEALKVQETVFEKYNVPPSSRNVYKSRLGNFIDWVRRQGWIKSSSGCSPSRHNPKMRHGHGNSRSKLLTNKTTKLKNYSLQTHSSWNTQKVEKIVEEVNQLYSCLVDDLYPGRLFDPIETSTASGYVTYLYLMLGWLVNHKNIQPEQLSLNLLVPISIEALYNNLEVMDFEEKQKKLIDEKDYLEYKIAQYVDTWICKLFKFYKEERDCQSDGTLGNFLNSIRAIVRYQYLGRTEDETYKDIPVIAIINKHIGTCRKMLKINNR